MPSLYVYWTHVVVNELFVFIQPWEKEVDGQSLNQKDKGTVKKLQIFKVYQSLQLTYDKISGLFVNGSWAN